MELVSVTLAPDDKVLRSLKPQRKPMATQHVGERHEENINRADRMALSSVFQLMNYRSLDSPPT